MAVIHALVLLEVQGTEQLRLEDQEVLVLKEPRHLEERDQVPQGHLEEVPPRRMEGETKEQTGLDQENQAITEGGQAATEASKMEAEKTIEIVEERGSLKLEAEEDALTVFLRLVLMLVLEQMQESSNPVSMDAQRDVPNIFFTNYII